MNNNVMDIFYSVMLSIIGILLLIITVILANMYDKSNYHYDVNNDGIVDARDYVLIKNYIMSMEE